MSKQKKRQRKALLSIASNGRDRPRCTYCGAAMSRKVGPPGSPPIIMGGELTYPFSMDHVVPRAHGGTSDLRNMTPCCSPCNADKAQDDLVVFIARLGERAVLPAEEARQLQVRARNACLSNRRN